MLVLTCSVVLNIVLLGAIIGMASSGRCSHVWIVTAWGYTPPDRHTDFKGRGPTAMSVIKDLMYGYTMVTYHCEKCRMPRTQKFVGKYYPEPGEEGLGLDTEQ